MKNKRIFYFVLFLLGVGALALAVGVSRNLAQEKLKNDIGQMLIVGFRGTEAGKDSFIVKAIQELNIGGVILFDIDGPTKTFPRNIINASQVKELIRSLREGASIPLIVSVDAEGGRVNRLKPDYGFIAVPSAKELGDQDDLARTREVSQALAKELAELGFNMNFAPCVDLEINPENPVIAQMGRSFSADAETVIRHAAAFIKGQHGHGILTAIKHFPGHGSSRQDSHKGLTDVTATYCENELIPYRELVKDGVVDMVMTAHIMNTNIDARYPATLSDRYIKEILREELGFQGVVVSDDLQMGAIAEHYGFQEAVVRAVLAGCDLLIISNNGKIYDEAAVRQARDIILQAVKDGVIPSRRIKEALKRIHAMKARLRSGSSK